MVMQCRRHFFTRRATRFCSDTAGLCFAAHRSKKAKRMMKVQSANMKSYCMSSAMMGAMDAPGSIEAQAEEAQGRMRMVQKALCQVDEDDSDGDFDAQLSLAAPVVTEGAGLADLPTLPAGPLAEAEPVDTSTDAAFQELLDKLKKEPEDSGEAGAKFKLYETFLDTVQLMRSKTLDFWEECKEDFADAPTAAAAVQRELDAIDSHGNMSIGGAAGRWFVYDMTLQASANSDTIGKVLKSMHGKLELLGRQDECPICLEAFEGESGAEADPAAPGGTGGAGASPDDDEETAPGSAYPALPPHVLGCCHKVCGACWKQWTDLKGAGAPCPLCRHEDFLADIVEGRAVPPVLYASISVEE